MSRPKSSRSNARCSQSQSRVTGVDFPSSGPKDGDLVEASGTTVGSSGALQATRLELRTGKDLRADMNGQMEVEGLITRFVSATDFDVAGRAVTTSSSTTFEGGCRERSRTERSGRSRRHDQCSRRALRRESPDWATGGGPDCRSGGFRGRDGRNGRRTRDPGQR